MMLMVVGLLLLSAPVSRAGIDTNGDGICEPCLDMSSCSDSDCKQAKQVIKQDHKKGRKDIIDFIGKSHGKDGVGGTGQFKKFEDWYGKGNGTDTPFKSGFVPEHMIRALQMMTEQLSAVAHQQMLATGMFFDSINKLSYQRKFQELKAKAHVDYHPSKDFCWFGTNVRSLAHSDQRTYLNKQALHKRQISRHLATAPTSSSGMKGDDDRQTRWEQFLAVYCDPEDNNFMPSQANTGLDAICTDNANKRVNRDIDFTRLVEYPRTLDLNFTVDNDPTLENEEEDEEDVLALSSNLYGHDALTRRMDEDLLKNKSSQELYLALRSVVAKRGVAENSFNSIVALKSAGTADVGNTRDFLGAIIKELGVTDNDEIYELIGKNPSYYAQLELLAKKIYQNPDFYANLYDKPANIKRKSTALKALELMVDRAMYESQLRREMITSVLLSAQLQKSFDTVEDSLGTKPKE